MHPSKLPGEFAGFHLTRRHTTSTIVRGQAFPLLATWKFNQIISADMFLKFLEHQWDLKPETCVFVFDRVESAVVTRECTFLRAQVGAILWKHSCGMYKGSMSLLKAWILDCCHLIVTQNLLHTTLLSIQWMLYIARSRCWQLDVPPNFAVWYGSPTAFSCKTRDSLWVHTYDPQPWFAVGSRNSTRHYRVIMGDHWSTEPSLQILQPEGPCHQKSSFEICCWVMWRCPGYHLPAASQAILHWGDVHP